MKNISKSDYRCFKCCPKQYWCLIHKKEEYVQDPDAQHHIEEGILVGNLAKQYFANTLDVTATNADGSLDIQAMIDATKASLSSNRTIAEASFFSQGLFCSVDLLHPVNDGYKIYEVKASTSVKEEHYFDVAFQAYVLKQAGLNIRGVYILHLNSNYRRHGALDLHQLFQADRIDQMKPYLNAAAEIAQNIMEMKAIYGSVNEPSCDVSSNCKDCPFKAYCHRGIPFPTVLDVIGSKTVNRYKLYNRGVRTFRELLDSGTKLSRFQDEQIHCYLYEQEKVINKAALKSFLSTLKYPLYHLDFESIMMAVPPVDDAKPYQQIPTQYSLHIEQVDGSLEHKEFLGTTIDPRREIAEHLCQDIPMGVCVIAYNKNFEAGRLMELAALYPDLAVHLQNIASNIVDLMEPFKDGDYYHKDMWNSYSIKAVLPALCPNDPELDYHALPLVHNGAEAMSIYPKMVNAPEDEAKVIRDGLLKYCRLDTLAMVKVLAKIKEAAK